MVVLSLKKAFIRCLKCKGLNTCGLPFICFDSFFIAGAKTPTPLCPFFKPRLCQGVGMLKLSEVLYSSPHPEIHPSNPIHPITLLHPSEMTFFSILCGTKIWCLKIISHVSVSFVHFISPDLPLLFLLLTLFSARKKDYGRDMFGGNIGRECRQMTRGNMFCILSSSFSSSFSSTSKQKNN